MNYYIKEKGGIKSIDEISNKQNKLYYYNAVVSATTNWKCSSYADLGLDISDKTVIGATSTGGNTSVYTFLVNAHTTDLYYSCSPAASFNVYIWYFIR